MGPAYCWSSILSNGCKMSECKRKERIVDKEPGRLKISLACVLNLFSSFSLSLPRLRLCFNLSGS